MKHWILAALLFATPAFAARIKNYASQLGGTNLVQRIPGQFPLRTTTDAGTLLQSANSGVLIFETNLAPIGTFTPAYTLTDISGSVTTFGFTFRSPVPEPTRVVLLGTGLAAIACRRFRG